jgi:urease accessory protein
MVIKEKLGNLADYPHEGRGIDRLPVEWHECGKRILSKRTGAGREVVLKFLGESHRLQQDDVLYADDKSLIVVEVLACEVIVLKPSTLYKLAYACYEIGNKHLPLFFENDTLLLPYDAPVFRMLQAAGFEPQLQLRKLLNQLRTTVAAHANPGEKGESLFSKILKLTTSTTND